MHLKSITSLMVPKELQECLKSQKAPSLEIFDSYMGVCLKEYNFSTAETVYRLLDLLISSQMSNISNSTHSIPKSILQYIKIFNYYNTKEATKIFLKFDLFYKIVLLSSQYGSENSFEALSNIILYEILFSDENWTHLKTYFLSLNHSIKDESKNKNHALTIYKFLDEHKNLSTSKLFSAYPELRSLISTKLVEPIFHKILDGKSLNDKSIQLIFPILEDFVLQFFSPGNSEQQFNSTHIQALSTLYSMLNSLNLENELCDYERRKNHLSHTKVKKFKSSNESKIPGNITEEEFEINYVQKYHVFVETQISSAIKRATFKKSLLKNPYSVVLKVQHELIFNALTLSNAHFIQNFCNSLLSLNKTQAMDFFIHNNDYSLDSEFIFPALVYVHSKLLCFNQQFFDEFLNCLTITMNNATIKDKEYHPLILGSKALNYLKYEVFSKMRIPMLLTFCQSCIQLWDEKNPLNNIINQQLLTCLLGKLDCFKTNLMLTNPTEFSQLCEIVLKCLKFQQEYKLDTIQNHSSKFPMVVISVFCRFVSSTLNRMLEIWFYTKDLSLNPQITAEYTKTLIDGIFQIIFTQIESLEEFCLLETFPSRTIYLEYLLDWLDIALLGELRCPLMILNPKLSSYNPGTNLKYTVKILTVFNSFYGSYQLNLADEFQTTYDYQLRKWFEVWNSNLKPLLLYELTTTESNDKILIQTELSKFIVNMLHLQWTNFTKHGKSTEKNILGDSVIFRYKGIAAIFLEPILKDLFKLTVSNYSHTTQLSNFVQEILKLALQNLTHTLELLKKTEIKTDAENKHFFLESEICFHTFLLNSTLRYQHNSFSNDNSYISIIENQLSIFLDIMNVFLPIIKWIVLQDKSLNSNERKLAILAFMFKFLQMVLASFININSPHISRELNDNAVSLMSQICAKIRKVTQTCFKHCCDNKGENLTNSLINLYDFIIQFRQTLVGAFEQNLKEKEQNFSSLIIQQQFDEFVVQQSLNWLSNISKKEDVLLNSNRNLAVIISRFLTYLENLPQNTSNQLCNESINVIQNHFLNLKEHQDKNCKIDCRNILTMYKILTSLFRITLKEKPLEINKICQVEILLTEIVQKFYENQTKQKDNCQTSKAEFNTLLEIILDSMELIDSLGKNENENFSVQNSNNGIFNNHEKLFRFLSQFFDIKDEFFTRNTLDDNLNFDKTSSGQAIKWFCQTFQKTIILAIQENEIPNMSAFLISFVSCKTDIKSTNSHEKYGFYELFWIKFRQHFITWIWNNWKPDIILSNLEILKSFRQASQNSKVENEYSINLLLYLWALEILISASPNNTVIKWAQNLTQTLLMKMFHNYIEIYRKFLHDLTSSKSEQIQNQKNQIIFRDVLIYQFLCPLKYFLKKLKDPKEVQTAISMAFSSFQQICVLKNQQNNKQPNSKNDSIFFVEIETIILYTDIWTTCIVRGSNTILSCQTDSCPALELTRFNKEGGLSCNFLTVTHCISLCAKLICATTLFSNNTHHQLLGIEMALSFSKLINTLTRVFQHLCASEGLTNKRKWQKKAKILENTSKIHLRYSRIKTALWPFWIVEFSFVLAHGLSQQINPKNQLTKACDIIRNTLMDIMGSCDKQTLSFVHWSLVLAHKNAQITGNNSYSLREKSNYNSESLNHYNNGNDVIKARNLIAKFCQGVFEDFERHHRYKGKN